MREAIRAQALAEGFDVVRFAAAKSPAGAAVRLGEFLARGHEGDMAWMRTTAERRADPHVLWPDAKSIIVLGLNYGPAADPLPSLEERGRATISVYAQGDDYHELMKKKLRRLASFIATRFGAEVKLFVDTAPVMEKPIAQMAGMGWQGKHTNLVSRAFGSWLFLGSIFTTLALEADAPEEDHCGTCRRCLDICPTAAFPAPYQLDARRCISYLTIEHKGHIPRGFRAAIGNRVYGCDDCLAVCPWNRFARAAHDIGLHPRAELARTRLEDLALLDDRGFRDVFRGSPVKRLGRDRLVRNVLIAIGNAGDESLARIARRLIDDASPLVRAMAVWALSRLLPESGFAQLRDARAAAESDPAVNAEWFSADAAMS